MRTALEWKTYYNSPEFKENYIYEGNDLGVSCSRKGTRFLLWSPSAERVALLLYENGSGTPPFRQIAMERVDKGVWLYETEEYLHGIYYDYELVIEGRTVQSADPYARACGVNGQRSMAVDLKETDPPGWELDKAPALQTEQVIYELHVKEFSWDKSGGFPEEYRGTYKALGMGDTTLYGEGSYPTGTAYLKNLGVTHIQLMPVFDYGSVEEALEGELRDSHFNWGYDPVNYNVPEGSYATDAMDGQVRIRELKEMILSLHRQGFRVIMDVVYNHTYSLDSWFQRTVPWYFYRTEADGSPSNGSGCGNDMASERCMCGRYILESVLYWAEEYHMDGFRFDLMGLLDVELMNCIRKELDARWGKGEKMVFGEPWAAEKTAMEPGAVQALKENMVLLDTHVGMFCDDTRDAVKGSVFELEEPGFVNGGIGLEDKILSSVKAWCGLPGKGTGLACPSQVITYVSSHDNQTLYDKLTDTIKEEELRIKACRLAAGIYMTCQGTLFLLSGEEFLRTKNGMENSYDAPVTVNRLDWSRAARFQDMTEYYRGLIALRKQLPGLCDKTEAAFERIFGQWKKPGLAGFFVDNKSESVPCRWKTLMIMYNSTAKTQEARLPEGRWEILADGENSFLWQSQEGVKGQAKAAPMSILVLGRV